jgi:hypothetical protein
LEEKMAVTRELPPCEWTDFLRAFNGRNYARPVRLETSIPPGEGLPLLSAHQPLVGVELDLKGSEAPAITVALGGLNAEAPHFTHVINEPTRLWVEEEPRGRTLGLCVESEDEGQTRLLFLHQEALAEAPGV